MSTLFKIKMDHKRKRVFKSGSVKALCLEALMTKKAYDLASRHKIFRVPEVVSFDPIQGVLELELIDNIFPLKPLLPNVSELSPLLLNAAESLVIVHEELKLKKEDIVQVPDYLAGDFYGAGAIHGDFTLRNVQYDISNNRLVILDWSFAPGFKQAANFGPRYFDLSWMVNSLFSSPPYSYFSLRPERKELARIFLNHYFRLCEKRADFNLFRQYFYMTSKLFFHRMKLRTPWYRFLRKRKNWRALLKFAESLK